jgi:secretion/DNA translocation related CpaE-like protein
MSAAVLLVTADPALLSAVPRLSALAGVRCDVERDSAAVTAAWRDSLVVLVGSDVAPALAAAGLPRRDRVLVLTVGPPAVGDWQAAVGLGATRLLQLPDDDVALVEQLRSDPTPHGSASRVIGVVGGRGGAGASTLAAALAITAARSGPALLLDGDPLGGGLDVLVGAETVPGVRWNDLASTRGGLDAQAFAGAICDVHGMGLLSWGRTGPGALEPEAVQAVLVAARRAFTTVVIDLPRSPGRLTDCLFAAIETSVVVVPADVRSVASTAALMSAVGRRLVAPQLVVRDPGGSRLPAKDVAASLGLPLTTTLRSEAAVQDAAERGEPPIRRGRCALTQACEAVLATVASES